MCIRDSIESVESLGKLPSINDLDAGAVNAAISHDKKVTSGRPVFVLPDHPGSVVLRSDISPAVVLSAIKKILKTIDTHFKVHTTRRAPSSEKVRGAIS